ncbi:hypothetical protein ACFL26_01895 [Patescibacteria group bacterium]
MHTRLVGSLILSALFALAACGGNSSEQNPTDAADTVPDADGDAPVPDSDIEAENVRLGEVTEALPVEEPDELPDNVECPGPLPPVMLAFSNPDGTCRLEFSRHYVRGSRAARTQCCCSGEEYWQFLDDAEISLRDSEYLAVTLQPEQVVDGGMYLAYQGYRDVELRGEDDPLHWPHLNRIDRLSRMTAEGRSYFNCECPEGAESYDERCTCQLFVGTTVEYDGSGDPESCDLYPDGNATDWPAATFENGDGQICHEHLPEAIVPFEQCDGDGCICGIELAPEFLHGGDTLRFMPFVYQSAGGPLTEHRCTARHSDGSHRLTFTAAELLEQFGEPGRYGRFSVYGGETGDCADLEDEGRSWMPFDENDLIPYHTYEMRQFARCPWYDGEAVARLHDGPYGWCYPSIAIDLEYDAANGRHTCRIVPAGNMGAYTMRLPL